MSLKTSWKNSLFIGFVVCLTGCIRDVEKLNYPDNTTTKLVIAAIISPEQPTIKVKVVKSKPFFNSAGANILIKDANVFLSDNENNIQLKYTPFILNGAEYQELSSYKADSSDFNIQAGKTYYLTVTTPDGLSAKSHCTVPHQVQILNVEKLKPEIIDSNRTYYPLNITWNDEINELYYFFSVYSENKDIKHYSNDTLFGFDYNYIGALIHTGQIAGTMKAQFNGFENFRYSQYSKKLIKKVFF